jgi:hypothetical protein
MMLPQPQMQFPRPPSRVMPPSPTGINNPLPPVSGPVGVGAPVVRPIGPARPVAGMFHKGGKVPRTAAYLLKKGEHVIPAGKRKMTNRPPQKLVSLSALGG